MRRLAIFYVVTLVSLGLGIFFVLRFGEHRIAATPPVSSPPTTVVVSTDTPTMEVLFTGFRGNIDAPVGRLLLQFLVIILASRAVGWVFVRCGQPAVVGEMAAGVLLGPSLLGLVAPSAFHFVFPPTSLGTLQLLSQLGVCLFMFNVGMQLNVKHLRGNATAAVTVSHASIVIPFFLGVVLASFLFRPLAAPGTTFTAFALFMGISVSVTAFPVLARILQERGLAQTPLGSTAITCAAVDDVTAWCVLAFVIAVVRATSVGAAALNLVVVVAFVSIMVWVVRRLLPRQLGQSALQQSEPSKRVLATVACVVMGSALATETIGIHGLFGAFLAGAIMPEINGFREKVAVRVENFSSILLLPLFFTYTGLRTQIGLLNDVEGWLLCLLIVAVATVGKLAGSALAARLSGMNWHDSLSLGALMNTRGLMELIVLNVGYDLGILGPRIFTMLVVMALTTTLMTGPLLTLFLKLPATPNAAAVPETEVVKT